MGFNVTTLGQKVTMYESTVGLDVTRNKATGVKSHIIDIDKKMNRPILSNLRSASLLFFSLTTICCELHPTLLSIMDGNIYIFKYMYSHHTAFLLSSCYPGITWQLADDIF